MVQMRSNIPTTSHVGGEEIAPGSGNGTGGIASTPDAVQALFGLGVTTEQLQAAVAALSAMGGNVPGAGAGKAPLGHHTEHAATSQHKGKKTRRSRRRPGKDPVIEEVLVEDVPEGEDDESSECRVSAFKRLGGEETRVSAFDRLNCGPEGRQGDLRRQISEARWRNAEESANSDARSARPERTEGRTHERTQRRQSPTRTEKTKIPEQGMTELAREIAELKRRVETNSPYSQPILRTVTPFTPRVMSVPLPTNFRPWQIKAYSGTTNPRDHFSKFYASMEAAAAPDEVKCRCFLATLEGSACDWFNRLPKGTIDDWDTHFAANRRQRLPYSHLLNICIRKGEKGGCSLVVNSKEVPCSFVRSLGVRYLRAKVLRLVLLGFSSCIGLGEGQSTTRPSLFDGTNYTYWKERMRIFIQSNNFLLWRIIKNGEEVPMKKVGETTVPKTKEEYDAQDIKKIENNAKAINIFYCAVNPDDYRKISCCSTAKEMWDKLEITYEGTNQIREAKIDFLTHEYELFLMKENEKIDEMFERFSKIVNDLHALKKTYTDKELESTQKKPYYFFYYDEKKKIHISLPEPTQIKPRYRHSVRVDWNPPTAKRQVGQGGQRKRSRTGKNVASSSAPPPPAHKYLDGSFLWFNDHAEATRFSEKFEHREILPPRFSTARFIHDSIPREARVILERGNFLDLLYIKKVNYHPSLARAFYSNLKKDEDGALISNVNGVDIYLNEENIQILTGLRRDGQDLGLYVGEEGARFNETALLEERWAFILTPTPKLGRREQIQFTEKDLPNTPSPHRDALVVKIEINDAIVHRTLVDTGSSVNIMYEKTFQDLGLNRKDLWSGCYHDGRVRARGFIEGEWVLRKRSVSRPLEGGKLDKNYEGPYIIKEVVGPSTFRLKTPSGGDVPKTWNAKNLVKFYQ
ncbi:unnamed protein product [Cuscuta campestris]|uniref:Retrotransposon gag domain-containing protein n=1 Tax=Cuscuta campestris TaxID=132261 RepID=A0A484KX87_9ASTE|nr:unnamed protein product [Cuscuta campestris]